MPDRIQRLCLSVGCGELVDTGFCPSHARQAYDPQRGNSNTRGYDSKWRHFRGQFLKFNPVCSDCWMASATEVHHKKKLKDNPELKFVRTNLAGLCKECHSKRTAAGE